MLIFKKKRLLFMIFCKKQQKTVEKTWQREICVYGIVYIINVNHAYGERLVSSFYIVLWNFIPHYSTV